MNEAATNPCQTRPATFDPLLWGTGLAFWTLFFLALAIAVLGSEPRRAVVITGTASVNKMGDVISWDAEHATGFSHREMLFSDFFRIVPEAKRNGAREMFARGQEGLPYSFHEVYWSDAGVTYSVRFSKAGDVYLATIAKR